MRVTKSAFIPVVSALACALLLAARAQAQEPVLVEPRPLSQEGRFMPGFGSEGLIRVRYTVKADGSTTDVKLLGGMTNQFYDNMLRQSIAKWTFTPGTVNGEAADFHNQELLIALRIDPNAPPPMMGGPGGRRGGGPAPTPAADGEGPEGMPAPMDPALRPPIPLGLSPDAKEVYDEVTALIEAKDYEKAVKELDKALRRDMRTVMDYALGHELKASALMGLNQPLAALEASRQATLSTINARGEQEFFLTEDILGPALYKRFVLAMLTSQNKLAWDTYELLQARSPMPADDRIHEQATAIKAKLDSPEPLGLMAQITDKNWSYEPARRIFTVTNVEGKLNRINARCQRRDLELKYQDGVDWTLPPTLGACTLDFEGRDGTTFNVYEFAE